MGGGWEASEEGAGAPTKAPAAAPRIVQASSKPCGLGHATVRSFFTPSTATRPCLRRSVPRIWNKRPAGPCPCFSGTAGMRRGGSAGPRRCRCRCRCQHHDDSPGVAWGLPGTAWPRSRCPTWRARFRGCQPVAALQNVTLDANGIYQTLHLNARSANASRCTDSARLAREAARGRG